MTYEDIEAICTDKALFSRVVTDVNASKEEAARIEAAFLLVFKKNIIRSCGNCVGDALAQLCWLYKGNPEQMKKQIQCKYRLKAGALIRLNFGDRQVYSNENLTNDIAEQYILAKPSRLGQFQKYPPSIKRKIKSKIGSDTNAEPSNSAFDSAIKQNNNGNEGRRPEGNPEPGGDGQQAAGNPEL